MSNTPRVPAAGGTDPSGRVAVELAAPTDLTNKVELNWKATRDLDFAVVIAAEGEKTRVLLAERNHSMTIDVRPGVKYCFMVQASDGDQVYESEPQPLRGATCGK
jgi:Interferon-alpha/beta receptor, fibronectin type III